MKPLNYLRSMNKLISIGLIWLCIVSCDKQEDVLFTNPSSKDTGLVFTNSITENDELNILDYLYFYNGGGVALGDVNNDGLLDVFLSGNQVENKLYLNKGNLKFEDITASAGVSGNSSWNTGSVMGDVNGDGLLDIYVCAVVGINGFYGYNELYINNGDETFTEKAKDYGLDFTSYSSTAAFLDFDLDGDLDMYLLNHAVHTQESFGMAELRNKRNYQTGDKLLRNDGDTFTDVSEQAGIYGGINGYGLGISVADFNQDGYPDIFVGNDFHEDDYYYLNNGDGTFSEELKTYFGHTSRFSMGSDVADINHDGLPDIISLDMLPEDEVVLKSSEGDDDIQIQNMKIEKFGYHNQYSRNMLFINQPDNKFMETALLSGVAATDWSWSSLFGDYNQDGELDMFVSNGIPKRPNDLDFIKFASSEQIQNKLNKTKLVDQQALDMMPAGHSQNYVFKGKGNLEFENKSNQWLPEQQTVSGATATGDLDNDGDLDLVVNNINENVTIYLNRTNDTKSYLKLNFDYTEKNRFGIGTKVYAYQNGQLKFRELYTVRGFQSSSEPVLHFGYDTISKIDSIKVVWPDKTYQTLKNVRLNQSLTIAPRNQEPYTYKTTKPNEKLFKKVKNNLGIDFTHVEDNYTHFNRQKLIPHQFSDMGPAVAVGDLNNDGKNDIFFGGSKFKSSKVYLQADSTYVQTNINTIVSDSIKEEVVAVIRDFNNDSKNDLFVGSGGADFYGKNKPLLDNIYIQTDVAFTNAELTEYFENASVIKTNDFDNDGDLDLFIGVSVISNDYGKSPNSYILKNNDGQFEILEHQPFQNTGMINDAIFEDYNGDGKADLILVGEWMPPKFFKNSNGVFVADNVDLKNLSGLWQKVTTFDIDHDGDNDYLLGNWGLNSKFKATIEYPLRMYYSDFDNNGSTETIICNFKNGKYYPILGLDEMAGQMVSLRKRFRDYKSFAGKSIDEIFDSKTLSTAEILDVHTLASGYLKNDSGNFKFVPFKNELQVSPITAFLAYDFDGDGREEVLTAGNYFGVQPFHGRFDSFPGALIHDENNMVLANSLGLDFHQKSIRHLDILSLKNKTYLLTTINNDDAQVYQIMK